MAYGLTKQQTKDELLKLSDKLFNGSFTNQNIECIFDDTLSSYTGFTYIDNTQKIAYVEIGIFNIANAKLGPIKSKFAMISDKDFALAIINLYHETMHIKQNELYKQPDLPDTMKSQLMQTIACFGSPDYYKNELNNYNNNANELQAEQFGIQKAYEYLCFRFQNISNKYHEKVILGIINEKQHNTTYFINKNTAFASLDEINQAFDKAYDESFMKNRNFNPYRNAENDEIKSFMISQPEAIEAYKHTKTPLEQDKCLAIINLKLHPEWFDCFPVLRTMNLSYEDYIQKPMQRYLRNPIERNELEIKMKYGMIPPDEEFSQKQTIQNDKLQKALQELSFKLDSQDNNDYTK